MESIRHMESLGAKAGQGGSCAYGVPAASRVCPLLCRCPTLLSMLSVEPSNSSVSCTPLGRSPSVLTRTVDSALHSGVSAGRMEKPVHGLGLWPSPPPFCFLGLVNFSKMLLFLKYEHLLYF